MPESPGFMNSLTSVETVKHKKSEVTWKEVVITIGGRLFPDLALSCVISSSLPVQLYLIAVERLDGTHGDATIYFSLSKTRVLSIIRAVTTPFLVRKPIYRILPVWYTLWPTLLLHL